ncbi:MAG: mobile mystery protein A [Gemmatimonadaceae bacterium]|nr:mobile mystery protein A [Gemmatimonadaceae bacterium]
MPVRADTQWLRLRQAIALLEPWQTLRSARAPSQGWVSTIRRGLGMSSAQLAVRMQFSRQSLEALEAREVAGTATIEALRRAADALDCDLVYALVPRQGSLDDVVTAQARRVATRLVGRAGHTMALEQQTVAGSETEQQIAVLTRRLLAEWPRGLWDEIAHLSPRDERPAGDVA